MYHEGNMSNTHVNDHQLVLLTCNTYMSKRGVILDICLIHLVSDEYLHSTVSKVKTIKERLAFPGFANKQFSFIVSPNIIEAFLSKRIPTTIFMSLYMWNMLL